MRQPEEFGQFGGVSVGYNQIPCEISRFSLPAAAQRLF